MNERIPDAARELFRAAPEDFILARDGVVKRLRDEGRGDEAAAVKVLRKPTLVVWALNQLADRAADAVAGLLDAGRELRAAQAAVSKGGGADRLRAAVEARRERVAHLSAVASQALADAGHGSEAQADRIATALEAASVDPEAGPRLSEGTLEEVPQAPAGFGDVFGLTAIPGGAEAPAPPKSSARSDAEAARLRKERDAAVKTATRHRATADRLARQIEQLRGKLEVLQTERSSAEAEARRSELEAKRAERALARARG